MKTADRIRQLSAFHVMKILSRAHELEREGRSIVHMEVGEPDFPTPQRVIAAAQAAIAEGDIKYTPAAGLPVLREKIAGHYRQRYGLEIDADRIYVTPGASGAFLLLMGMLINEGAETALADPGYPCYPNLIRLFGGEPVLISTHQANGFHLDPDTLGERWSDQMAGLILASPANPTGAVMPSVTLKKLVDFVRQRDGYLISDEIYHGLEYGVRSPTALEFSADIFVVNSFSKYFGMTGWRLGWTIVPDRYRTILEKLAQNMFISAPTHSQRAALAAFEPENIEELEQRRKEFEARRNLLLKGLVALGFTVPAPPQGAFYLYADCSQVAEQSHLFCNTLLERFGVAATPGIDFGVNQPERYVRFCYTASQGQLEEGLRRLERYVGAGG